jgi:hypothetical protein
MNFYATFGLDDPERAKRYQIIKATSKQKARELMFAEYGQKWAFLYTAEEFEGQPERYHLAPMSGVLGGHPMIPPGVRILLAAAACWAVVLLIIWAFFK